MDAPFEVHDSTDWLNTPLAGLAPVEAALRCQVCKDFFATPMITSCSHTFCSICIRRCLAAEGKCPACRSTEQEVKLRRNGIVEELVEAFRAAREAALGFARDASTQAPNVQRKRLKRKLGEREPGCNTERPTKSPIRTRSQSRQQATSSQEQEIADSETEQSSDDQAQQDDGLAPCPMCGRRMKLELIWPHLDQCEKDQNHQEKPPSAKPAVSVTSSFNSSAQSNLFNAQSRLPQLNYSLYKENSLRKKLSELGIRTTGPKQLLERRHTEWVNLWNANCDANRPRSKKDLLRELEVWERTQGTPTPGSHFGAGMGGGPSGVGGAAGSAVMRKDFDGAVWSATHDASFKDLIVKARRKKGEGDAKQEELESNQGPITSTPERAALNGQTASEVFMIDSSDTEPVSHGRPDLNDNVWSSPVHPLAQSQTSAEKPVHDDLGQDPIVDEANET